MYNNHLVLPNINFQPKFVYTLLSHLAPAVAVQKISAHDTIAIVHVNVTIPGSLMCTYYSQTIRPAFANRDVHHAGHARLVLKDLTPEITYTVECSLHANSVTATSVKETFTTPAHEGSHLEITDVESYSTFARVTVRSDTPGEVRCMPMRKHMGHGHGFGHGSMHTFKRFAKRFLVCTCVLLLLLLLL